MSAESHENLALLEEAEATLRRLSPDRLYVARDFLAYLEGREELEATAELVQPTGFEDALRRAAQQAESGDVVRFRDVRRDV